MKALNNVKFISEATTELDKWIDQISRASNFEKAKRKAEGAIGFIDCLTTYCNCLLCVENNDLTGELGELLDNMTARVYQAAANKAIETKQPDEITVKLLKRRDEYRD